MNQGQHDENTGPGHETGTQDGHGNDTVTVSIDTVPKTIHRGSYTTEELKTVLGVAPERELDVIEDGVFRPLRPGERITVKNGMEFVSQQPGGGSA